MIYLILGWLFIGFLTSICVWFYNYKEESYLAVTPKVIGECIAFTYMGLISFIVLLIAVWLGTDYKDFVLFKIKKGNNG